MYGCSVVGQSPVAAGALRMYARSVCDATATLPLAALCIPVKVELDLEQIAIEGFLALTCLLGPFDDHIKSLQLLDTGKVVNLHKFKMAAVQSLNLQITFFWLFLYPINVLQTTFFGLYLFIY